MAVSRRWYVSLEAVKASLGPLTGTTHDANLKRLIERASAWLERETSRTFQPVTATAYYDCPDNLTGDLVLHDDLLALVSLTDYDGAWLASEYLLYPLNGERRSRIRPVGRSWSYESNPHRAITLAARWGYSEASETTGATLSAAITLTTATTITVSDGTLIETGWTLKIDDEQMFVSGVSGGTITVQRGNNGTTAATHLNAAAVYRVVPVFETEQAVTLLVQTWWNWADTVGIASKSVNTGGYSATFGGQWPIPDTVKDITEKLRKRLISAVY